MEAPASDGGIIGAITNTTARSGMFVCLSSGYRPRYLRDIARSLALPPGAWLAFRYNREWIADEVLRRLEPPADPTKLNGADILIAYIDQHDPSKPIEIVPCRYATLRDVAPLGQTTSLQLELGDLAYAADLVRRVRHRADQR
jgi:hypothetical protein